MIIEILIVLYGLIIGSFLNVLIYRLPRGISLLHPKRSYCPNCNHQIKWYENIPLFSYLLLRAKCSNCHTSIPLRYFIVEILSGIIALAVYFKIGLSVEFFITLILFYLLLTLTFIDFEYKAVPDYLLLFILIVMFFIPNFELTSALLFAGGFVLLDFVITFYIQNIKSRLTGNKELEEQVALGEGDIPIVAMIGGILGVKLGIIAIFLAALFAILPSLYATITKKDIETPFIPYLTLGFAMVFFYTEFFLQILNRLGV